MTNTITANLDAEIAKAKKQAAQRIAKLKREAAAEQKKIDAKVIELLREQEPALHEALARQAVDALAAAKGKSAKSMRRPASADSSAPTGYFNPPRTFGAGE
ncbi:hypothetical protein SCMU_00440 [Sinomonas cyclohexanicum]|uniref:DNA-binding protein H-NS n=1 Tax=Sinomonas cyclohexanicum TaxID=322009 RepID=A0ABM7PPS3_SINCY|nr:hypothetical protein [Corynebacterium cyclohexanicum]BCT74202.1 hypothetical protein SCMU_00440 [Corynebacterium cyclohexanicum]